MFLNLVVQITAPLPSPSSTNLLNVVSEWLNVIKTGLEILCLISAVAVVILSPDLYLWFVKRKKLLEEQAVAYQSYYPKLESNMNELRRLLDEEGQLEIKNLKKGNIYALRYEEKNYRARVCPDYKPPVLDNGSMLRNKIKEVYDLLDSSENVYPRRTREADWQQQIGTLKAFCEFILELEFQETTTPQKPTHIKETKKLIEAFDFVINAIEKR